MEKTSPPSPWQCSRWAMTDAQWASARAACAAVIYPEGLPSGDVDDVTPGWTDATMPEHWSAWCSSVDRWTVAAPGGRSGGTPVYLYHCHPVATRVHKCMLFLCGHEQPPVYWTTNYVDNDGSSLIGAFLLAGWDVVIADMPARGFNPAVQQIVIGGVLTTVNIHAYAPLDADSGPSAYRMFTEHLVLATNRILATMAPTQFVIAGHSGGAQTVPIIGVVDSRASIIVAMEGSLPQSAMIYPFTDAPSANLYGAINEYESYTAGPLFLAAPQADYGALTAMAAAVPGRTTLVCCSLYDSNFTLGSVAALRSYYARLAACLPASCALRLIEQEYWAGSKGGQHDMSPAAVAEIASLIL